MYFEIQYPVGNAVGCVHQRLIYHDHDKDIFLYNIFDHKHSDITGSITNYLG